LEITEPERLLHLKDQLHVSGNAGSAVDTEVDHPNPFTISLVE
jgi:hypothetical protein